MHTYQREPDEECAEVWIYRFRGSDKMGGICFMPSGQYKSSHQFPSSQIKQQDEGVKETKNEVKVENVSYQ